MMTEMFLSVLFALHNHSFSKVLGVNHLINVLKFQSFDKCFIKITHEKSYALTTFYIILSLYWNLKLPYKELVYIQMMSYTPYRFTVDVSSNEIGADMYRFFL